MMTRHRPGELDAETGRFWPTETQLIGRRLGRCIRRLAVLLIVAGSGCRTALPAGQVCYTCGAESCQSQPVDRCTETDTGISGREPDPRPHSGDIDLTGDGVPEHIALQDNTVTVYEGGIEVWRSPDNWRVVDMTCGDPNDDGRGEVVLAFWRDDEDGIARSHPFIIGYRGGIYRTLWGGSPVREPIDEIELGDLDGDGTQELVVLEAHSATDRTIAVWRWHGWGFSLQWRSEPGDYTDLVLPANASDGTASVRVTQVP